MNKIAVLGLGKVGTLVGVLLSEKFKVTGFDIRAPHYDMKLPFTVKQLDIERWIISKLQWKAWTL